MVSTSSSSTERPPSPPPQSRPPPSQPPLRDPFCEEPIPQRFHWEARVNKRKRVEENQDKSLLHGFELKPHVIKILESNNLSSLQDLINDFVNPPLSKTLIIDSLALHYPNALAFKLAKLLQSQPLLQIRTTIVSILFNIFRCDVKFNSSVLIELKNPLLDSVKLESDESLLPQLCGVIGFVAANLYFYPVGGWEELLEYVCTCVSGEVNSNSNFTKGLMLLAALPSIVADSREFWIDQGNYRALYFKLLMVTDNDLVDPKYQEFLIEAWLTMMGMANDRDKPVMCDYLMPILLEFIDCHKEEESVVLQKIRLLADLVTMDTGTFFKGKESDLFWCMIRVAEVKEASQELRIAVLIVLAELDERNMDGMKSLLQSLSGEEVKRVFEVAVGMMSCFVEDPIWYEVDNVDSPEAGMTETFFRGRCLLNWLYLDGDKSVVIPIVVEMLTVKYASHCDWQARYAAMTTICATAQGGHFNRDMIKHLEQFVGFILKSLDHEMNHQVVWATLHAIRCLSGYKELFNKEYHVQLLAKMAPIINSSVDRLMLYALIAVRPLVTNCRLEKISAILEDILRRVLLLFKLQDKQMVQLEAIETLQSIAVKIPITFQDSYYDQTIIALKDIMLENSSSNYFLRAKCLECMANLVRKIEQDKFKDQEADVVMDFVVTLDRQLSNTDHITRIVILTALDQFCRCPKVNVDRFIDKVMPILLRSAQLDTDLTAESQDDNQRYVEVLRVQACNLLSYCAHRSFKKFPPYIDQVTKIFKRWIGCSSLETRKASISAFPNILHSIKLSALNDPSRRALTSRTVHSLIDALRQETDSDLSAKMLKLLPSCILISGSFFTSQLVKSIADEIRRIMKVSFEIEAVRADEEESPQWGGKFLPFEEVTQDQIYLILTTIETFRERYLPYVEDFLTIVSHCLDDGISERLAAISLNIFNIIVPHFPEKLPKFIVNYFHTASHFSKENFPRSRLHAARAIGICAEFGAHNFKFIAHEGFARLSDVIINTQNGDLSTLYDTAVAALGKICEFQRHIIDDPMDLSKKIDDPTVVRKWLDFLPLKSDFNEAKYAHGLLSKMIQRSDTDLFGDNNENLPKIISIVKEILSGPDRMATEEDINQMIDFIDEHGGMETDNVDISLGSIAL